MRVSGLVLLAQQNGKIRGGNVGRDPVSETVFLSHLPLIVAVIGGPFLLAKG